ncbi:MAG: hypothetical protein ACOCP8_10480 [archaeon]
MIKKYVYVCIVFIMLFSSVNVMALTFEIENNDDNVTDDNITKLTRAIDIVKKETSKNISDRRIIKCPDSESTVRCSIPLDPKINERLIVDDKKIVKCPGDESTTKCSAPLEMLNDNKYNQNKDIELSSKIMQTHKNLSKIMTKNRNYKNVQDAIDLFLE